MEIMYGLHLMQIPQSPHPLAPSPFDGEGVKRKCSRTLSPQSGERAGVRGERE